LSHRPVWETLCECNWVPLSCQRQAAAATCCSSAYACTMCAWLVCPSGAGALCLDSRCRESLPMPSFIYRYTINNGNLGRRDSCLQLCNPLRHSPCSHAAQPPADFSCCQCTTPPGTSLPPFILFFRLSGQPRDGAWQTYIQGGLFSLLQVVLRAMTLSKPQARCKNPTLFSFSARAMTHSKPTRCKVGLFSLFFWVQVVLLQCNADPAMR
jgi:hypothetical protein